MQICQRATLFARFDRRVVRSAPDTVLADTPAILRSNYDSLFDRSRYDRIPALPRRRQRRRCRKELKALEGKWKAVSTEAQGLTLPERQDPAIYVRRRREWQIDRQVRRCRRSGHDHGRSEDAWSGRDSPFRRLDLFHTHRFFSSANTTLPAARSSAACRQSMQTKAIAPSRHRSAAGQGVSRKAVKPRTSLRRPWRIPDGERGPSRRRGHRWGRCKAGR